MKKLAVLVFLLFLLFASVSAINLGVEKTSSNEVMIYNINEPAVLDLKIKNLGSSDNFQFYNLLGFSMFPGGTVQIAGGETKNVQIIIYPREDLNYHGFYTFEYFIQGQNGEKISEKATIKIIDLSDAFEVGSGDISPETNSIDIYISNKVNFDFDDLDLKFESAFFKIDESFSLKAYEEKSFKVQLDKEDFEKLMAGFYTLSANVVFKEKTAEVEGVIKFVEKDLLVTSEESYGLIINTLAIEKKNDGNVLAKSETVVKKNIISRLFATFNPEPDSADRHGFFVYYTWESEIKPGESLKINIKTNWLFPLLVIFFVATIVFLAKQYSRTNIVLSKRVSFIRSKGGEFALKISLFVNAKKHVERVNVVDRIPPLASVYERFGGERPARFDEKTKRIEWELGNMDAGERRVLSYVIYSKVGVMGTFTLPGATAVYEKDGEIHEVESNRAFFIAEQRGKNIE